MTTNALSALAEMESAEDFLNHFEIPFDPARLMPRRINLLKRFHAVIEARPEIAEDAAALRAALADAYQDCLDKSLGRDIDAKGAAGGGRRLIAPPPRADEPAAVGNCAPAPAGSCYLGCC
jgi:hypothetical protein